jgi:hypothetical protein
MPTNILATRALLSCRQAVMASQSASVPGFPFTSVIPIATTPSGQIISLLSESAQHTKNIAIDARVSMLLHDDIEQNWQEATRLSVLGHMRPLRCNAETLLTLRSAFDLLHPELKDMRPDTDYHGWILEPVRFRYVSSLGRIHWLDDVSPELFELSADVKAQLHALLAQRDIHAQIVQAASYGLQIIEQGHVRFLPLSEPVDAIDALLEQMNAGQFDDPANIE